MRSLHRFPPKLPAKTPKTRSHSAGSQLAKIPAIWRAFTTPVIEKSGVQALAETAHRLLTESHASRKIA